MNHYLSDSVLDEYLRDVPVPLGLVARLKQTAVPEDAELDQALRSPPLPAGLIDRLVSAVQDEALDEALRGTAVPEDLLPRLRMIPRPRRRSAWRRFAVAASLLFFLFTAYWGSLGVLLAALRPQQNFQTRLAIIELAPIELNSDSAYAELLAGIETETPAPRFVPPTRIEAEALSVELVRLDRAPGRGPAGDLFREVQRGAPLTKDVFLMRQDTLGSPQRSDQAPPELWHVRRQQVAGADLPLTPGYDRAFFLKSGVHPPVFPEASRLAETITVPLATRTDSVAAAQRLVLEGRQPLSADIRVEDFIASIDYGSESSDELTLRATAGLAAFGRQTHHLLHLGVKAPMVSASSATHVSLVLDVSASMQGIDRMGAVRHALEIWRRHLGPDDSCSLVAVNHGIVRQIDFLPGDESAKLTSILGGLRPAGGDNLALGFQAAMSLAFEADVPAGTSRHVILITDGQAKIGGRDAAQLRELMAIGELHSIRSTFLQLDRLAPNDRLVSPTDLRRASLVSPHQLPWSLLAISTGKSPVVASRVRLRATFDPKAVLAYRLVGHGPTAVTGLVEVDADLHSGQEANALFELWLRPGGTSDVGWAEVQWIDPATGSARTSERLPIDRSGFAGSVEQGDWPLRAAEIAAEVGRRLAGTGRFELQHAGRFSQQDQPPGWNDILEQAARIDPHGEHDDFQQIVDLVRQLEARGLGPAKGLPRMRLEMLDASHKTR